MVFDIKEFYSSLSTELQSHAINFTKQFITINKEDHTNIQKNFNVTIKKTPWQKKNITLMLLWALMME